MTAAVVEIGPNTVRGSRHRLPDWVVGAVEAIDDELGLLDERPVPTVEMWCDVLDAAVGDHAGAVVLVLPTWWSAHRSAVVTAAAHRAVHHFRVYSRAALLTKGTDAVVIEVAEEVLLVASAHAEPVVLDRRAADLTAHLGGVGRVLIDVPAGVTPLGADQVAQLRAAGLQVGYAGRQQFSDTASEEDRAPQAGPDRDRRRGAGRAAIVIVAATAAGWAMHTPATPVPRDGSTVVTEGRVGVRVPAHWTVQRVTAGPGSARVRIADPSGSAAVHFTQSSLGEAVAPAELADSLRAAIDAEPPGVFVDFDPDGRVGARDAVTYREVRAHSHTRWAVLVEGTTSIAVGCQSSPDRVAELAEICTRAVESAHQAN
ncbi:type VII secretion-associated protein [Mycobacterium sp. SMC-4]|uniref:type VII secretion-associated protein n=1 Tax=Mycobacterium sp. SMC-4 TaxID=2857059 RepID=UPI0021B3F0A2|nr:type VII secretion-associated protein [Mycobacterium sp. SMC-4]UXA19029.1 type VII secretion-associated protein [Mycobacterium sp. SMC-4]